MAEEMSVSTLPSLELLSFAKLNLAELRRVILSYSRRQVDFDPTTLVARPKDWLETRAQLDDPSSVMVMPLMLLTDEQREAFETIPVSSFYPEIGSRACVSLIEVTEVGVVCVGPTRRDEFALKLFLLRPSRPRAQINLCNLLRSKTTRAMWTARVEFGD